jgi:hypothetical protein
MLAWFNEFQAYRIASNLETTLECLREFYLMGRGQMNIQRSCTLQYCVKPFKLIQVCSSAIDARSVQNHVSNFSFLLFVFHYTSALVVAG